MEPHHETGFPTTLCRWVGEIVQSSPEAARLTLAELVVGALLASGGHVTQAILALTPRLGWQAYPGAGLASARARKSLTTWMYGSRSSMNAIWELFSKITSSASGIPSASTAR